MTIPRTPDIGTLLKSAAGYNGLNAAVAEAARTGKPQQIRLNLAPAVPRIAHPDTRGSK